MNIDFEERGHALLIRPGIARLDAVVASEFRSKVTEKISGYQTVVLDMGQVGFVDSSGLGCLVSILKSIPPGGQLRLAGINSNIATLLKLTRLEKIFPTYPNAEAALVG